MGDLLQVVTLTLVAGLAMPIGALIADVESIRPYWLESEVRHSIIAFGGGALLAAVALVLIPEGISHSSLIVIVICFASGGIMFMLLDMYLAKHNTPLSQLVAMLSDFVPEALALGATFAVSGDAGFLLAGIIALQNLPEGFNAYREIRSATDYGRFHIVSAFTLMALLGPVSGLLGYFVFSGHPQIISGIMLFAAGGILYIIFQDIAPQSKLKKHWAPPLGAVAGFLLGVLGKVAVGL